MVQPVKTGGELMSEAVHRATLLGRGAVPGRALEWCRQGNNTALLREWQARAGALMVHDFSEEEVKAFWQALSGCGEMAGFIRSLGPGGAQLCRRGCRGERYSVPVFYLVIRDFIPDYLWYVTAAAGTDGVSRTVVS